MKNFPYRIFIKASGDWLIKILASLFMTLTGLVVIPFGLVEANEGGRFEFKNHDNQYWTYITMPALFYWWDNQRDGAMGDKRGDYWLGKYQPGAPWNKTNYLKMYFWLAIRNPHNNFDRYGFIGYDVTGAKVTKAWESDDGQMRLWQCVNEWNETTYAFQIVGKFWIGNKILPKHNELDYQIEIGEDPEKGCKGFTIRFDGYKS